MNDVIKWKNYLAEDRSRPRHRGMYKFLCMIEYGVDPAVGRGLNDIVTDIRACPNVTIVDIVIGNKNIGPKRYAAGLRIKFISSHPGQLIQPEQTKTNILSLVKKVKGVFRLSRVSHGLDRVE
jgi:hypothetical protein